jgi:hypothetical protein
MHDFTLVIRNGRYIFQLQNNHQAVYVRSIKGNHVPVYHTTRIVTNDYWKIFWRYISRCVVVIVTHKLAFTV